ncbi:hypothetical protein ACFLV0_01540 [Chloroflexota bacterium]
MMDVSPKIRSGEVSSHIFIILVTLAQLIFFTRFHRYIGWHTTEPDGSVIRLSMLTDDYFTWIPIMITASIIVIITSIAMIIYDNYQFRKTAEISFNIIGIVVSVSLVSIFPFDFSVIPNTTAVEVIPISVTVFFILLPIFYGVTAYIMFLRLRKYMKSKTLVRQQS